MTFVRPEAWAVLAVLPLLALGLGLCRAERRRLLVRFVQSAADAAVRRGEAFSRLVAVALLTVALVGPAVGDRLVEVPARGIDVLVVLDASRSMRVADEDPDRLERAKRELHDLAERFRGGRLGLMVFGGGAELVCPLTGDHDAFAGFVRAVDPLFQRSGGTDVAAALRAVSDAFGDTDARRVVVLVSDGEHLGDVDAVEDASWRLFGSGTVVHALLVGGEVGGPVPADPVSGRFVTAEDGTRVVSRARPDVLRRIASRTGGTFVVARDAVFPLARLVEEQLSDVVAVGVETTLRREPIERYRWLLWPALLLLLLTWRPRVVRLHQAAAGALALGLVAPAWLGLAADEPDVPAREGNARYADGEFEAALERFDAAAAAAPEHPGVRFNRGAALHRLERYRDAARAFDAARARAEGGLRAKAAFGAGVARARQAERELVDAGADARRLEAVGSLLREARADLVQALASGYGRDAAVDLELVTLLLDELRRREEQARRPPDEAPPGEPADGDPDDASAAGEDDRTTAPDDAGAGEAAPDHAEAAPADDRGDFPGEGPVDGEGGGEARFPGGLFREEARSLEEIVRRYERERLELDRKHAREARRRTERDW